MVLPTNPHIPLIKIFTPKNGPGRFHYPAEQDVLISRKIPRRS